MLVVFTPILNYLFFRHRPGMGNLLGILLILPGMYLLTEPGRGEANVGDVITLVSAAGFSLYIIFLDRYTREADLMPLLFWQIFGATVFSGICALLFEEIRFRMTPNLIWTLLYLSPLATFFTLYLQNRYQKETTSVRAGILFAMEPVFATTLAVLILNEFPGANSFAGGALIVTGVIVSGVLGSRSRRE
jgi:drug/metabolite transporter (DMT)-like permease